MTGRRFANLPRERREELLRIAVKHFAEHGLEGASLNEIIAEAGLSKGVYYYYFEDKDDLYAETIRFAVESFYAKVPPLPLEKITRQNFWRVVESMVPKMLDLVFSEPELTRLMMDVNRGKRSDPRLKPVFEAGFKMFRAFIEVGQKVGCVRTDLPIEMLTTLLGSMDEVLDLEFVKQHTDYTRSAMESHATLVLDTFQRLMRADIKPITTRDAAKRRSRPESRRDRRK